MKFTRLRAAIGNKTIKAIDAAEALADKRKEKRDMAFREKTLKNYKELKGGKPLDERAFEIFLMLEKSEAEKNSISAKIKYWTE